jgi:hypothetical protein
MKFIYFFFTCLVLLTSCETSFTSKSQAKNEVNKQGLRDGKWVDYFDESDNLIQDTSNYFYYTLSIYDNGTPKGSFNSYYQNGKLKTNGTFSSILRENQQLDKSNFPKKFVGVKLEYDYEKIYMKQLFNDIGNVTNWTIYLKHNNKIDSIQIELEYSKSNAIIKETNRTSQDSIIIVYTYDSLPLMSDKKFNNFYSSTLVKNYKKEMFKIINQKTGDEFLDKIKEVYISKLIDPSDMQKLILIQDYRLVDPAKMEGNLIKFPTKNGDRYYIQKGETKQRENINKLYNAYATSSSVRSGNAGGYSNGSIVTCRTCGRNIVLPDGFGVVAATSKGVPSAVAIATYKIMNLTGVAAGAPGDGGGIDFYCNIQHLHAAGYQY